MLGRETLLLPSSVRYLVLGALVCVPLFLYVLYLLYRLQLRLRGYPQGGLPLLQVFLALVSALHRLLTFRWRACAADLEWLRLHECVTRDARRWADLGVIEYWNGHVMRRHASRVALCSVPVASPSQSESTDPVPLTRSYTYAELDAASTSVAHWALHVARIQPGSVVSLLMENRPEFIMIWLGLAKIGVTISCVNTSLRGEQLLHCLRVAKARSIIFSSRFLKAWQSCTNLLSSEERPCAFLMADHFNSSSPSSSPTSVSTSASCQSLERKWLEGGVGSTTELNRVRLSVPRPRGTPLFHIFTSGTTGLPKAANFSHERFAGAGITWAHAMRLNSSDVYYITLPLFHGNGGVVAVAAAFHSGATIVLREKFSVSNFWKDIRAYKCTATIYIGELWNYLVKVPERADDHKNTLRVIAGNGLRSEAWDPVRRRFGIDRIVEHYGQTEMPAGPYINSMGQVGACGYIPPLIRWATDNDALVLYDEERGCVIRDETTKYCRESRSGEAIFRLLEPYKGYTDPSATEKKIYRDVFAKGDGWFATGDLLRLDETGFFYFLDRVGDTYRWRGENISTIEVQQTLLRYECVQEANVYGVRVGCNPGRAGMVCLRVGSHFDIDSFQSFVHDHLPKQARPLFVRILPPGKAVQRTETLKFQKAAYQREGYNPLLCNGDTVYFLDHRLKTAAQDRRAVPSRVDHGSCTSLAYRPLDISV
eukprot:CAMPEP_0174239278 /NCGR_PEP_ID=MMETSP0417-20130205/14068_1 /TAXON_ID=242541 /ORGANISM="Mayorella sp, Strain BSH-02190019" /LENGTH=708 /DNA_ID=CAMNT_0015318209 /DNA_START=145 /DNA_END=2267 /DNA_ORIENTATION=-